MYDVSTYGGRDEVMTGSGGAGGVAGLRLGELELWMVEDLRCAIC